RATTTPALASIAGYGSDKRRATWSKAIAASSSRSRLSKNVMKSLILQIALKQHYQSRVGGPPNESAIQSKRWATVASALPAAKKLCFVSGHACVRTPIVRGPDYSLGP